MERKQARTPSGAGELSRILSPVRLPVSPPGLGSSLTPLGPDPDTTPALTVLGPRASELCCDKFNHSCIVLKQKNLTLFRAPSKKGAGRFSIHNPLFLRLNIGKIVDLGASSERIRGPAVLDAS